MDSGFHGSLEHADVFHSQGYHAWSDGVEISEIDPQIVHDLSETFLNAFGDHGLDVYSVNGLENAAMSLQTDPSLYYDSNLLWSVGEHFGPDAISGVLAHEVGHHVVESVFGDRAAEITPYQHELCADYVSGIMTQLGGMSPEAMHQFYSDPTIAAVQDVEHPAGSLRSEAFDKGMAWAADHTNAVYAEFLLKDPTLVAEMLQTDVLCQFPASVEDYLQADVGQAHSIKADSAPEEDVEGKKSPASSESTGSIAFKGSDPYNHDYYKNSADSHRDSAERYERDAANRFDLASRNADDPAKAQQYINEGKNWASKADSERRAAQDDADKADSYR